jgi:hypothetical protein
MLQDLEAGRPLETDALIGSVVEIAEALGIPTPSIRAVDAAVRLLAATRGLGPFAVDTPSGTPTTGNVAATAITEIVPEVR